MHTAHTGTRLRPTLWHQHCLTAHHHCFTCSVSHCPHENVELRLRPPGIDLWTTHQPSTAEACMLFLVMGAGEGARRCCLHGRVLRVLQPRVSCQGRHCGRPKLASVLAREPDRFPYMLTLCFLCTPHPSAPSIHSLPAPPAGSAGQQPCVPGSAG